MKKYMWNFLCCLSLLISSGCATSEIEEQNRKLMEENQRLMQKNRELLGVKKEIEPSAPHLESQPVTSAVEEPEAGIPNGVRLVTLPQGTVIQLKEGPDAGKWFGVTEVTIGQYLEYLRATGEERGVDWMSPDCPIKKDGGTYVLSGSRFGISLNQPMVCVSRPAAERFCQWITTVMPAEQWASGLVCRLPAYEEWLSVAGTIDEPTMLAQGWIRKNSVLATHECRTAEANSHGFYDLYGNVWEWSSSNWDGGEAYCNGGSWYTSYRFASQPNWQIESSMKTIIGFRLICAADKK